MNRAFRASGRVLLSRAMVTGAVDLDVSGIAPGRYILRSCNGNDVRCTAVMVMR